MTPTLGRRSALVLAGAAGLARPALAEPVRMVIGTGVDPSFSAYYVAMEAGIFARNGLDVQIKTGPSGSAMVALLIQNQAQSAFGSELAGVLDHALDPEVVTVAEGAVLAHWYGLVARNIDTLDGLKGKKIGVARGTGSEVFWLAILEKKQLNPKDYTIVQVEAPEMVAAVGRGDIDAFAIWEPWVTRGVAAVPGTRVLLDNVGIVESRTFVYMNKGWILKNQAAALAFVQSLVEATDRIETDRDAAAADVAKFLKMDMALAKLLMGKLRFGMHLDDGSIADISLAAAQLRGSGKLGKPVDWTGLFYPDLLRQIDPARAVYTLPQG